MQTFTDPQIEHAVIAALVADSSAFDEVSDLINPNHFAIDAYRRIADAVWRMHADREPVDAITVRSRLMEDGAFRREVEISLDGLASGFSSSLNVRPYAESMREMWACREIAAVGDKLWRDPEGTSAERIEWATAALGAICVGSETRARSIGEMFDAFVAELKKERTEKAPTTIFQTGMRVLDDLIGGFRPGVLSVFAARPSVGKSSIAVAMASNLAARDIPVGVLWLEDDWRDFTRRAMARRLRIRSVALRHGTSLTPGDWSAIEMNGDKLKKLPIFVEDTHGMTVTEIATRMRRMSREHGVKVFFADHLGEMRVEREERWGDRHDLALGRAARTYRDTAKSLGAAPILMVQMNRGIDKRADATPRLSDIDGSGQIEQAARLVAFCSRPKDEDGLSREFVLDVAKNSTGPTAEIRLGWTEDYMAVEDA